MKAKKRIYLLLIFRRKMTLKEKKLRSLFLSSSLLKM